MSLEGYENSWIEADLYPAEASLVKKGDLVNVTIAGFENEPQKMRIDFIAPSFQTGSQLLTIRGTFLTTIISLKQACRPLFKYLLIKHPGIHNACRCNHS